MLASHTIIDFHRPFAVATSRFSRLLLIFWLLGGLHGLAGASDFESVALQSSELTESSGLAVSQHDPNLVWTHNDSGSKPLIYLFDRLQGTLRGIFELSDTKAIDWEDMCAFEFEGRRFLAIGDTGDNHRRRKKVTIHVIEEPAPPPKVLFSEVNATGPVPQTTRSPVILPIRRKHSIDIVYPDGAVDCESLAFDAQASKFLLLTKELLRCRVYSVPLDAAQLRTDTFGSAKVPSECRAEYVQTLGIPLATAADICTSTQRLVVCTYGPAYLLDRENIGWSERTMARIKMPKRRQGETIAFVDSQTLLATSEFAPTPLWTIRLPSTITEKSSHGN